MPDRRADRAAPAARPRVAGPRRLAAIAFMLAAAGARGAVADEPADAPAPGASTLVREQAIARDPGDGRVLYREQHWMRRDGAGRPLERVVLYRCAGAEGGGHAFARKHLDYRADAAAPRFQFDDARDGYREGLRAGTPPRLFVRAGQAGTERAAALRGGRVVVDAGFDEFVRAHWDALAAGRALPLEFAVPSRLRSYRFLVGRVDGASAPLAGEPTLRLRLRLDGWLAWVAPHVDASYGLRSRRLLRFEGLGTIRDLAGGKPLPARIDFEGAPRPGDEAGWTAALAGPLSACAAGRRADANTGGADSAGAALSR
jgi:hypothetical protein